MVLILQVAIRSSSDSSPHIPIPREVVEEVVLIPQGVHLSVVWPALGDTEEVELTECVTLILSSSLGGGENDTAGLGGLFELYIKYPIYRI